MMSSKLLVLLASLTLTSCYADVEVSWDWPVTRENGDFLALSEIEGATIRYQRTGDEPVFLVLPGLNSIHIIEKLPPGEWNFAVATVDTNGLSSDYSDTNGVLISITGSKSYFE